MKEKSHKRKIALKKRRQKILIKKTLRADIGKFLSNFWMLRVEYPTSYVHLLLKEGFKGFDNMRSKDLVGNFEEAYKDLRDKKQTITFYWKRTNWEATDDDRKALGERDTENEKERLSTESEGLMNRLIELAFDLDFEE